MREINYLVSRVGVRMEVADLLTGRREERRRTTLIIWRIGVEVGRAELSLTYCNPTPTHRGLFELLKIPLHPGVVAFSGSN